MGYNITEYEHLSRWYNKMQSLSAFEENQAGAKALADFAKMVYPGETMY
jgi:hypothetical protein